MTKDQIKKLIKWKVDEPPTGRYRSFSKRGWPTCYYKNERENVCAWITCEDEYYPPNVKIGKYKELKLIIAHYGRKDEEHSWIRVVAKTKPKTLNEAKELLLKILEQSQDIIPQEIKEK